MTPSENECEARQLALLVLLDWITREQVIAAVEYLRQIAPGEPIVRERAARIVEERSLR